MAQRQHENDVLRLAVLVERNIARLASGYDERAELLVHGPPDQRVTLENAKGVEDQVSGRACGDWILGSGKLENPIEVGFRACREL